MKRHTKTRITGYICLTVLLVFVCLFACFKTGTFTGKSEPFGNPIAAAEVRKEAGEIAELVGLGNPGRKENEAFLVVEGDVLEKEATIGETYGALTIHRFEALGETVLCYENEIAAREAWKKLRKRYDCYVDRRVRVSLCDTGQTGYTAVNDLGLSALIEKPLPVDTTVAVLDTGVDPTADYPFFRTGDGRSRIHEKSMNYVGESQEASDINGHGTAVTGVVAQATPENVSLLSCGVVDPDSGETSVLLFNTALKYVIAQGADVINISVQFLDGGNESSTSTYLPIIATINRAADAGIMTCVAAGNGLIVENDGERQILTENIDGGIYPACIPAVITVASINRDMEHSAFSNYGNTVDFTAPGENILTAATGGGTVVESGTSLSSPYLAACLANLKGYYPGKDYSDYIEMLKEHCMDLGESGKDPYYGWGCPNLAFLAGQEGEITGYEKRIPEEPSFDQCENGQIVDTGYCGENLKYSIKAQVISENNIGFSLEFSGEGAMIDKETGTYPWSAYRDSIRSITFSDQMTTIGNCAFLDCVKLQYIEIPSSLTGIGYGAFAGCPDLNLKLAADIGNLKYVGRNLYDKNAETGEWELLLCNHETCQYDTLTDEAVTAIAPYAFYGRSLHSVTLAPEVDIIGSYAFANCYNLSRIELEGENVTVGENAFVHVNAEAYCHRNVVQADYGGKLHWHVMPSRLTVENLQIHYHTDKGDYLIGAGEKVPEVGYPYDPAGTRPSFCLIYRDQMLMENVDYTIEYPDALSVPGTWARVIIEGLGNYTGQVTGYYHIEKKYFRFEEVISEFIETDAGKTGLIRLAEGEACTIFTDYYDKLDLSFSKGQDDSGNGGVRWDAAAYVMNAIRTGTVYLTAKVRSNAYYKVSADDSLLYVIQNLVIDISPKQEEEASTAAEETTTATEAEETTTATEAETAATTATTAKTVTTTVKKTTAKTVNKPAATYIVRLRRGRRAFTLRWKKRTKVSGYQIRYSRKSSMKSAKMITIKSYQTVSRRIRKLRKGKRYYVQVRTWKKVSGRRYYSAWSKKKSVRTK